MSITDVILFIKKWLEVNKPQSNFKLFKLLKDNKDYWDIINDYVKDFNVDDIEKIYRFFNKDLNVYKCICNNDLPFESFGKGFKKSCSRSCATKLKWNSGKMNDSLEKRGETFKERWGTNSTNHDKILNKRKVTSIEKYGTEHHMKSNDFYKNHKNKLLDKYGVDNVSKLQSVKDKISETWKNKENLQELINERSLKHKESLIEKYGVDNLMSIPSVKEKIVQSNLDSRGVQYNFQSKDIYEKGKAVCLQKYGFENAMQSEEIQKKCFEASTKLKDYKLPSGNIIKYQGHLNLALDILIKVYDETDIFIEFDCPRIEYMINDSRHFYRPDVFIKSKNKIIEVKSFYTFYSDLDKNLEKMKESYRQGYDFEFWIYSYQKDLFIFNFNENVFYNDIKDFNFIWGNDILFFYNERKIFKILENKEYSKNELKSLKNNLLQKNNNLEVIFIFNDLVNNKYDIILSRILNKLNYSKRIFARKCKIEEIDSKHCKLFLEKNHIQGYVGSKINIGLFYDDELVSLMTFGKKRLSLGTKVFTEGEYELLRFANLQGTSVVGGASKLFKYFINKYKPKTILSFADKNWSNGNLYEKLNFKKISETEPNYWYIKNGIRYHRFSFRKDILVKEGFDKNMTESEIMKSRNFIRIYDCGNIKYGLSF